MTFTSCPDCNAEYSTYGGGTCPNGCMPKGDDVAAEVSIPLSDLESFIDKYRGGKK